MTVTLNALERITILNRILPEETGSLRESLACRKLRNMIQFEEEEAERLTDEEGRINPSALGTVEPREYDLSEIQVDVISLGFEFVEESGKVPTDNVFLSLYEKFNA